MDTNFRGGKIKTFVWDMPKTIKLNWEGGLSNYHKIKKVVISKEQGQN